MIETREYYASKSCVFRKTKEQYGGLSNMAAGFPLIVNDIYFLSSEALYQACRFPHLPDVQSRIIYEKSPMTAKMVSKRYKKSTRQDWDVVKIRIMRWCLKIKLAQHFVKFGALLESTLDKPIVEDSPKDRYWGAIRDNSNHDLLQGVNALGRLLMELRQTYNEKRFSSDVFYASPVDIADFKVMGRQIEPVDERPKIISFIARSLYDRPNSFIYASHGNAQIMLNISGNQQPAPKKQNNQTNKNNTSAIQSELPF